MRVATKDDAGAIREVILAAFPTPVEADLVEVLGREGDAIVSLVATDGDEILGHILFSRMKAEGDGRAIHALGLAPVAVVPGRQAEGMGSTLIRAGLDEAKVAGAEIVFVLGEPAYYGRFGFEAAAAAPFASPYAGPYFQAKALSPQFTLPASGRADYAGAFAELA